MIGMNQAPRSDAEMSFYRSVRIDCGSIAAAATFDSGKCLTTPRREEYKEGRAITIIKGDLVSGRHRLIRSWFGPGIIADNGPQAKSKSNPPIRSRDHFRSNRGGESSNHHRL